MKDKFGEFEWHSWKDKKPEEDRYIYFHDLNTNDVVIEFYEGMDWHDSCYWCYVYIPDAPKIERELSLEDRIESLTNLVEKMMNHYDRLEERIDKLNIVIGNMMGSHDRLLDRVSKLELRK